MYNNKTDIKFNVGIYIRLSQEDKGKLYESDSESVINQRELLLNYVRNNKYDFVDEYVDDGYSGTNFDRPGFNKMIEDIKKKKINMVIVKDFSRFGRDHVMTGYYIETFFPENQVRFISILESYDSFKEQASNDSSTFVIACNDYYSKQNSVKIRNVLNEKRKKGKFIGSLPCYGYMRDENDKGKLVPNPDNAHVVKKIFKWANDGIGLSEITTRLNNAKIPTPSEYKQINFSCRLIVRDKWNISSVNKILKNRMYTGDMVQHVQTKVNYKSNKKIKLDESLWVIVEDTHEPLVSKKVFESIQRKRNIRNRTKDVTTNRKRQLLENMIFCKECGNMLTVTYHKNNDYWTINCNRYSRDPIRRRCEPHFFPYFYLEEQILNRITKTLTEHFKMLNIDELNEEVIKRTKTETNNIYENVIKLEKEKEKIGNKLKKLYDDKFDGIINIETYKIISEPLEKELNSIIKRIELEKIEIDEKKNKEKRIPNYKDKIKQLLNLEKPTRELLTSIIDKIKIDKDRKIEIYYKDNVIPMDSFIYANPCEIRNPYGRKGKNN